MRKSSNYRKSFKELVKANKQELLNDKQALEKIEKRIENAMNLKSLLNTA